MSQTLCAWCDEPATVIEVILGHKECACDEHAHYLDEYRRAEDRKRAHPDTYHIERKTGKYGDRWVIYTTTASGFVYADSTHMTQEGAENAVVRRQNSQAAASPADLA